MSARLGDGGVHDRCRPFAGGGGCGRASRSGDAASAGWFDR